MSQWLGDAGNLLRTFMMDEAGASAIEYGLLATGIAVAIIATVAALGSSLDETFTSVSNGVQ